MEELKVTSMEELKQLAQGEVIELPKFKEGMKFSVRVKRVSLLNLVRKGVIPNKLLSASEELFYGKQSSKGVDLKQLTEVMFIMAENTLVEPSVKDLKNVGLELTDEQIVALFNYSQEGVSDLESFRKKPKDNEYNSNEPTVQRKTE